MDNADTARRLNTYIFFSCALYFERNIEESILTPVIWHDFLFNGLACLTTLLSALDQGPQNFFFCGDTLEKRKYTCPFVIYTHATSRASVSDFSRNLALKIFQPIGSWVKPGQ